MREQAAKSKKSILRQINSVKVDVVVNTIKNLILHCVEVEINSLRLILKSFIGKDRLLAFKKSNKGEHVDLECIAQGRLYCFY